MGNTAYILDFNLLSEQNLSIQEFIALINLHSGIEAMDISIAITLEEKQFIKINRLDDNKLEIRENGKLLIDFVSIEGVASIANKKTVKKSNRALTEGMIEFVKEYRALWKGLKPGSMGSENTCKDKLLKWMTLNPSYSKSDILKAAKIYLKSVDNYQYLQQADYFIFKKDAFGESSRLSSFIDEIDIKIVDENWTTKLN